MHTITHNGNRPWLMEGVAAGAIVLSAGVAGIGVAGIVGVGSTLATLGTIALVGGTLLTEIAASRLPVHAEARAREGARAKAGLVGLGFVALTGWNVTAGHMGMVAVNAASVADTRGPLVETLAEATATREAAERDLAAFDARQERAADRLADQLRGVIGQGYVTSATRAMRDANSGAEADRAAKAEALANAQAAESRAQARVDAAPNGRPDHELWLFAVILELLKGALVWFASSSERRDRAAKSAEIVALAPRDVAEMSLDELNEMASRGASLAAKARHEKRRRLSQSRIALAS